MGIKGGRAVREHTTRKGMSFDILLAHRYSPSEIWAAFKLEAEKLGFTEEVPTILAYKRPGASFEAIKLLEITRKNIGTEATLRCHLFNVSEEDKDIIRDSRIERNEKYPMMKCGHRAQSQNGDGALLCIICAGINEGADKVAEEVTKKRIAECSCGSLASSLESIAFYKKNKPSELDEYYCGHSGWS